MCKCCEAGRSKRDKEIAYPLPCYSVNRECSWKKTQVEEKKDLRILTLLWEQDTFTVGE